jgi:hypothetical protein
MNIKTLNKNIVIPLAGFSIVLLSFLHVQLNKEDNTFVPQIESAQTEIQAIETKENRLKKYKDVPLELTKDNYIEFVKELSYLYKNAFDIEGMTVTLLNANDGLLESSLKISDDNKYVKYVEAEVKIILKGETQFELENFLMYYKPLIYFNKVAEGKPIIVDQVSRTGNVYTIKIKILGK